MIKQYSIFIYLGVILILSSCGKKKDVCENAPDVEGLVEEVTINRLEHDFFALESKSEIVDFLKRNPTYSKYFLNAGEFPNDSIFINSLHRLLNDAYMDTLYKDVSTHFTDMEDFKSDISRAFAYLKYYYPEFETPKIQTGVSGFGTDLYVSDSLIIIGLDFFLGRNGTYRPEGFPAYLIRRFEEEYIVPNIILNLSKEHNQLNPEKTTFLADMIFYGKSYYFTKRILPCTPDSLIIQFTAEELSDVRENDKIIWASFLTNELLYETSHFIKRKYLEERPNVPEIGKKCPGRVGAWVGWEVVEQFMEKNELTLNELMENPEAENIFQRSKYKPGS